MVYFTKCDLFHKNGSREEGWGKALSRFRALPTAAENRRGGTAETKFLQKGIEDANENDGLDCSRSVFRAGGSGIGL